MAGTIFRKGKEAIGGGPGAGKFIKIKDGDSVVFAPLTNLDEMISVDQHEFWDVQPAVIVPCIQKGCPACETGNEARFKAFLAVMTKEDGSKIFAFGRKVERQLEELEAELGSLKGKVLKVRRNGSGMSTSYTVIATGKTMNVSDAEVPDIISTLGPTTREEIKALLENRGVSSSDGEEEAVAPGKHGSDSGSWDEI